MRTEKAKVLLLLSRTFPREHRRAGEPTCFRENLAYGRKIHTVRVNKGNSWEKRCEGVVLGKKYLTVREWTGKPYNSEQVELARYDRIGLQKILMTYAGDDTLPKCWVDGAPVPIETVAANDGLSVQDFVDWFFGQHDTNIVEGVIIHFTDFRYKGRVL